MKSQGDKQKKVEHKRLVNIVKKDLKSKGWHITNQKDIVENRPATTDEQMLYAINQIREYCTIVERLIVNKPIDISEYKTKEEMHWIQKALLNRNRLGQLKGKGYRKIARMVGIKHPQQIKYHLTQLKKHNLL